MKKSNDLVRMVNLNEHIKAVVYLASRINLLALNSILMARQAGGFALGFGVIAHELREFSKELTLIMSNLMAVSGAAVNAVSQCQKQRRLESLLQRADSASPAGVLSQQLLIAANHRQEFDQALHAAYQHLNVFLEDADKHGRFGSVIARSLKIEATYSGQYRSTLTEVAQQFDQYIESVPTRINQLKRYLDNMQR